MFRKTLKTLVTVAIVWAGTSMGERATYADARDPYVVLGISYDADAAAIRAAHRKLVQFYHPDHAIENGVTIDEAAREFQAITEAYDILSDTDKKSEVDRERNSLSDSQVPRQSDVSAIEEGLQSKSVNWEDLNVAFKIYRAQRDLTSRLSVLRWFLIDLVDPHTDDPAIGDYLAHGITSEGYNSLSVHLGAAVDDTLKQNPALLSFVRARLLAETLPHGSLAATRTRLWVMQWLTAHPGSLADMLPLLEKFAPPLNLENMRAWRSLFETVAQALHKNPTLLPTVQEWLKGAEVSKARQWVAPDITLIDKAALPLGILKNSRRAPVDMNSLGLELASLRVIREEMTPTELKQARGILSLMAPRVLSQVARAPGFDLTEDVAMSLGILLETLREFDVVNPRIMNLVLDVGALRRETLALTHRSTEVLEAELRQTLDGWIHLPWKSRETENDPAWMVIHHLTDASTILGTSSHFKLLNSVAEISNSMGHELIQNVERLLPQSGDAKIAAFIYAHFLFFNGRLDIRKDPTWAAMISPLARAILSHPQTRENMLAVGHRRNDKRMYQQMASISSQPLASVDDAGPGLGVRVCIKLLDLAKAGLNLVISHN